MTIPLPEPRPTPETAEYWRQAALGTLALQRCRRCANVFHYPRSGCPQCGATELDWFAASGQGTLYSYVIVHAADPVYAVETPYAVAVVTLDEGPRLLTRIVDVEQTPAALQLDMPVQVRFERRGAVALPVFTPCPAGDPR